MPKRRSDESAIKRPFTSNFATRSGVYPPSSTTPAWKMKHEVGRFFESGIEFFMRFRDGIDKKIWKFAISFSRRNIGNFLKKKWKNLRNFFLENYKLGRTEFENVQGKRYFEDGYIRAGNNCTVNELRSCCVNREGKRLTRGGITTGELSFENNGRSSRGNVSTRSNLLNCCEIEHGTKFKFVHWIWYLHKVWSWFNSIS